MFHAGSNLSAMSLALSRKILSPDRSYVLRRPPTTLDFGENRPTNRKKKNQLSIHKLIIIFGIEKTLTAM